MKTLSLSTLCLTLSLFAGCDGQSPEQKRAAAVRKLEKTDCVAIAARAKRCRKAIEAASAKHRFHPSRERQEAYEMAARIHADGYAEPARCRSLVEARLRYLKKDCRKYSSVLAVDTCRKVQRRYQDQLSVLNRCFAAKGCAELADCFVKRYVTIAL